MNAGLVPVRQIEVVRQMWCLMRVISGVVTMAVAVIVSGCQFRMSRLFCCLSIHCRVRY